MRIRHMVYPTDESSYTYLNRLSQFCTTPCGTREDTVIRSNPWPYRVIEHIEDELHEGPPYKTGGKLDIIKGYFPADGFDLTPYSAYEGYPCTNNNSCKGLPKYTVTARWGCNPAVLDDLGLSRYTNDPEAFGTEGNIPPGLVDAGDYGATAWSMYQPGKPKYDFGVSLVELRELPDMLRDTANAFRKDWRRSKRKHKKDILLYGNKWFAKQWLSVHFGWVPFVSDLVRLAAAVRNYEREKKDFLKYHNRWIYRKGPVASGSDDNPNVLTLGNSCRHSMSSYTDSDFFGGSGTTRFSRHTKYKVWFAGRFKYYIPRLMKNKWTNWDYLTHQFGLSLNPELVWNLTPFSWLADWFGNIGDVLSNVSNYNYVCAKYAYVMAHSEVEYRIHSDAQLKDALASVNSAQWAIKFERKHRVPANPFGFNLAWEDLNAFQWSILSALGLGYLPYSKKRG